MKTIKLIQGKDNSDIKVTYKDQEAINVTVTKIALWNTSSLRLENNEIAPLHPITVSINDEYQILDILILKQSNENSQFTPNVINATSYVIDFEYMNSNEGCVIQVVHTAPNENYISLQCELKNGTQIIKKPVIKDDEEIVTPSKAKNQLKQIMYGCYILGISLFLYGLLSNCTEFPAFFLKFTHINVQVIETIIFFSYCALTILFGVLLNITLIPKSLEIEFDRRYITMK